MLEMAFNEINPYREAKFGQNNSAMDHSSTINAGMKGYLATNDDSLGGGSAHVLPKHSGQLLAVDEEAQDETYGSARQKMDERLNFTGPSDLMKQEPGLVKNRASEYIVKKRP